MPRKEEEKAPSTVFSKYAFYCLLRLLRDSYTEGLWIPGLLEDQHGLLECPPSMLKIKGDDKCTNDSGD